MKSILVYLLLYMPAPGQSSHTIATFVTREDCEAVKKHIVTPERTYSHLCIPANILDTRRDNRK